MSFYIRCVRSLVWVGLWLACCSQPVVAQADIVRSWNIGPVQDDFDTAEEFSDFEFGAAVAVSGNVAMAGMPSHNGTGRVGVYTLAKDTWSRTATLFPSDPQDTRFGGEIDVDGIHAVVAAGQAAYLFLRERGSEWRQVFRFASTSGARTLGSHVQYDHGIVAVSASGENLPGAVDLFQRDKHGSWRRAARIKASDGLATDGFGTSIALDRGTLVVGAPSANGTGAAYVYVREGARWVQRQKLLPSDAGGEFGHSVAIRRGIIIVGAPHAPPPDDTTFSQGTVYVFLPARGTWFESQKLIKGGFLLFGTSVAMGRGLIAASAPIEYGLPREGVASVFEWTGSYLTAAGDALRSNVGAGADLDFWDRRLIVGSPGPPFNAQPGTYGFARIVDFGSAALPQERATEQDAATDED
jgi:hypothetical protein